jgi:hypothetical protein
MELNKKEATLKECRSNAAFRRRLSKPFEMSNPLVPLHSSRKMSDSTSDEEFNLKQIKHFQLKREFCILYLSF